jgi:hypothetical protein
LHKKDRALLEMIQGYFYGVGKISTQRDDSIKYHVDSLKNLTVVMDHEPFRVPFSRLRRPKV